jgi:hypothetical protein
MDIVMSVVNFVKDNSGDILKALGALYTALLIIVKLTPTPKDDELLSKATGFILKIAGFFGVKK